MKTTLWVPLIACIGAVSALGGVLPYTNSGGTGTSAGLSSGFVINNNVGSSSIYDEEFFEATNKEVAFSFTIALPSVANYAVNSASVTFSGSSSFGLASSSVTFDEAEGGYDCFFSCDYSFSPASAAFNGGSYAVLTGISDGIHSAGVNVGSGANVDLLSLGFGNDLLDGGTLTLSGYRFVYTGLNSVSNSGFNALTEFGISVNGSGSESGVLNLDGYQATPEPQWMVIPVGGIFAMLYSYRRKRALSQGN